MLLVLVSLGRLAMYISWPKTQSTTHRLDQGMDSVLNFIKMNTLTKEFLIEVSSHYLYEWTKVAWEDNILMPEIADDGREEDGEVAWVSSARVDDGRQGPFGPPQPLLLGSRFTRHWGHFTLGTLLRTLTIFKFYLEFWKVKNWKVICAIVLRLFRL